jgi:hypothetical protein
MPGNDAEEERIGSALIGDAQATLGSGHEWTIRNSASCVREWEGRSDEDYEEAVVEDFQQYVHDAFVDTTWPACPRHPHHNLWWKDWWTCFEDNFPVAKLGELGEIRDAG